MDEKKLKTLMDFQHVAVNRELEELIEETEKRMDALGGELLSDEDLEEVNAAGNASGVLPERAKPILKGTEEKPSDI